MSLFLEAKQSLYRRLRAASGGASISLYHACGEFLALFNCATSIAGVLGTHGSSAEENVPLYRIPVEEMQSALLKLSARYSIALVEVMCDGEGSRFVLLWKIPVSAHQVIEGYPAASPEWMLQALERERKCDDLNLDEY